MSYIPERLQKLEIFLKALRADSQVILLLLKHGILRVRNELTGRLQIGRSSATVKASAPQNVEKRRGVDPVPEKAFPCIRTRVASRRYVLNRYRLKGHDSEATWSRKLRGKTSWGHDGRPGGVLFTDGIELALHEKSGNGELVPQKEQFPGKNSRDI